MNNPLHAAMAPASSGAPPGADTLLHAYLAQARGGKMSIMELFQAGQDLTARQRVADAVSLYRAWLTHTSSPLAFAVYFNLGVGLFALEDKDGAEQAYRRAIALKPDFMEAHLNLGTLLEQRQRYDEALAVWGKVPGYVKAAVPGDRALHVQALNNIGRLLENLKRYTEAEHALERSLLLDPDQTSVITHWVHLRQKQCAWPVYKPLAGLDTEAMIRGTSALAMLSASSEPHRQLAAAQRFVDEKIPKNLAPLSDGRAYGHRKMRIGYLSGDFVSHAVSILTAELYELHDRARVEVYAFSWSHEDGTPLRARVKGAMDHYIRIGNLTDEQAARCIREHEIDILVDLQGLTQGTRPAILAHRPAPLQVAYLGFPGPSALPGVDYVIADEFVLPPELAPHFTEQPLYMPHTFQINDRKRQIGPRPTRQACGLPEDAFVFCSFNNSFKITEAVFAAWMRILRRVPDSVLWLVSDHASVRANLCRVAEEMGVAGERLIFANRTGPADYLARYQAADLFLDTFPFNAGTTASDALWAGLPLLTYSGATFASRMAGSLLHAVDLPELVTFTLADYEEKAVALAADPARVAAMKAHLEATRATSKLFDSPRFVRDLEDLFAKLLGGLEIGPGGQAPAPVRLPPHAPMADALRVTNFKADASWGIADPARFHALVTEAAGLAVPGVFLGDNMFVWGRCNSLFEDKAFLQAWIANQRTEADQAMGWRRHLLATSAYHCAQLAGDFVECGVGNGTAMQTVIDYFGKDGFARRFWGFDRFDPDAPAEAAAYRQLRARFAGYPQVALAEGRLRHALAAHAPERIAFLHLALGDPDATVDALERLFDRMAPGATLVLDAYESAADGRALKARCDAWFDARRYRVMPLPTGQGLVIKR